jgi:lysine decarboxylase
VLKEARAELREIDGIDVLDHSLLDNESVIAWDPLRLTIDVRGTGATGYRIAHLAREMANVNFELASDTVAVAVFGLGTGTPARSRRLIDGLLTALEHLEAIPPDRKPEFALPPPWGETAMSPREAFLASQDVVSFREADGRISAEPLATYPPGIPNVLPGEILTRETLNFIADSIDHGGHVRGATDRDLTTLRVVSTDG